MQTDLPLPYVLKSRRPDRAEAPMVIVMHGRGADANDLADIAPMIDGTEGYRFLFPNAPTPWEAAPGMMFGFTWFNGLPPEPKSLEASRKRVLEFVDAAIKRFPTPPGKLVLAGFSQGALMALDAGLRTTRKVAGIVAMSGAIFEPELPDLSDRKSQPILIIHGTMDEMINVNLARRTRRVLEDQGLQPEYHEFAMGHHVTPESMGVVGEFIRKVLE